MSRLRRATHLAALLFLLASIAACNDQRFEASEAPDLDIVEANGETFLIDRKERRVFIFRDGEFAEIPLTPARAS